MTKPSGCGPTPTGRQDAGRQARAAREAAALRENLRRRKQQARAREDAVPLPSDPEPADDGGGSREGDCSKG